MSDIGGTAGLLLGLSAASVISIIETGIIALHKKESLKNRKKSYKFQITVIADNFLSNNLYDVIFSQSGHDCPVILCPVIPHPNCII